MICRRGSEAIGGHKVRAHPTAIPLFQVPGSKFPSAPLRYRDRYRNRDRHLASGSISDCDGDSDPETDSDTMSCRTRSGIPFVGWARFLCPPFENLVPRIEDWPYGSISSRLRVELNHKAEATDLDSDWHDLPAGE